MGDPDHRCIKENNVGSERSKEGLVAPISHGKDHSGPIITQFDLNPNTPAIHSKNANVENLPLMET